MHKVLRRGYREKSNNNNGALKSAWDCQRVQDMNPVVDAFLHANPADYRLRKF
jgi:hypothetical protein